MKDRLLIFYGFLIFTIITGVTLFAATGSVYLLKEDSSGEEFVEVADLYILNSLSEDSSAVQQKTQSSGVIYYDDNFLQEEVSSLKTPPAGKSLLDELKKKDPKWHKVEHTINKGDSVWKLAKQYETDYTLIIGQNSLTNPDQIIPGKKLTILTKQGILYKVKEGDTLSEIALKYRISQKSINDTNKIGKHLLAGTSIFLPDAIEIIEVHDKKAVEAMGKIADKEEEDKQNNPADDVPGDNSVSEKKRTNKGKFVWPASGRITSGFGMRVSPVYGKEMFHNGIDICVNEGTPVHAAAAGKIIYAGWKEGYGNMVVVRHSDNYLTVYAHLSSIKVKADQKVKQNQIIALSGNTGLTTGAHLHFEIRKYDTPLNPVRML